MEPWYKVVTARDEVQKGRSFNPDEFAIALEQVVAGAAPDDYRKPDQFFARTCFTQALTDHAGMVLRRLSGHTENTAPVMTLITQFGGGKTHTLTALYHLANSGPTAAKYSGVSELLKAAGLQAVPKAKVAVFVGNAWDPREGRETPWIDVAAQLGGESGVKALGAAARTTPPGTDALSAVFKAANAPVLVLFDEVLNYLNRHRGMGDSFYAFLQNLTVAMTGTTHGAAVVSLPRSQVEMTDHDLQWQERVSKVVRRVAKDLIANDEREISEVIRRRLFEDLGSDRVRANIARAYANWYFERRNQLPSEWTAVDTATTEAKAREFLRARFEASYPFHPATLTVFQRKWQSLPQYQQTRGTLAMLAQWVSKTLVSSVKGRAEPLITLGSAPLEAPEFRAVVLGQLGEPRLATAIESDVAGDLSHARSLDADTKGSLRDIHRRVGATIFFESSGGFTGQVARIPELRFALLEPDIDATSVDNAANALEAKGFYTRKVGTDGYRIAYQPTLRKVVNDRRASLEERDIRNAMRTAIQKEFDKGRNVGAVYFPADSAAVPDLPRFTVVVSDPELEWTGDKDVRGQTETWTRQRDGNSRLYPGSLVWCLRRPGRDLRDTVELMLAWKRVVKDARDGTLGEVPDRADAEGMANESESDVVDEVWAGYRFVVLLDPHEADGLKVIDLGAGHASAGETLIGRVIAALTSHGLLSNSVGASYIDRSWPPALKASGTWPLEGLRQAFLNGTLTRLLDADAVLKEKIVEFVARGDFGLGSGARDGGTFSRLWYAEQISPDEIRFDSGTFLLTRETAKRLKTPTIREEPPPYPPPPPPPPAEPADGRAKTLRLVGSVPPEAWTHLGIKVIPKLRSGQGLKARVEFEVTVEAKAAEHLVADLRQALEDLKLYGVTIEITD